MARRAGKAANRKARQRSAAQRAATRPAAPLPPAPATPPALPAGDADARAAVRLDPSPRVPPRTATSLGSTLTTSERAAYHYVERDLRNIGILTVLMAVLLFLAWFMFSALGLVG